MISQNQISLIEQTWAMIIPKQHLAAGIFYTKLFSLDTSLRPIFPTSLDKQKRKFLATVNLIVNSLRNIEQLVPMLQRMGWDQFDYSFESDHLYSIGGAFLHCIEVVLGDDYSLEAAEAWTLLYNQVAALMTNSMAQRRLMMEALA